MRLSAACQACQMCNHVFASYATVRRFKQSARQVPKQQSDRIMTRTKVPLKVSQQRRLNIIRAVLPSNRSKSARVVSMASLQAHRARVGRPSSLYRNGRQDMWARSLTALNVPYTPMHHRGSSGPSYALHLISLVRPASRKHGGQ